MSSVSYVQRARRAAWRLRDVTFLCADAALCGRWVRTLTEQLSALGTTSDPRPLTPDPPLRFTPRSCAVMSSFKTELLMSVVCTSVYQCVECSVYQCVECSVYQCVPVCTSV